MESKRLFFFECNLASRLYNDIDMVWDELKIGTRLLLRRELNNRHDINAVAVVYRKEDPMTGEVQDYRIGYIPRKKNEMIAQLLEMGWDNIFECHICRVNPDAHWEEQVSLIVRIVRNEQNNM